MTMLMAIRMIDDCAGSCAVRSDKPDAFSMIMLIGNSAKSDTPMPSRPEQQPMIKVSALNTCEMLRLDAPSARRMPISLVR